MGRREDIPELLVSPYWARCLEELAETLGEFRRQTDETRCELSKFKRFCDKFMKSCDPRWRRARNRALRRSKRNNATLKKQGRCR